MGRVRSTVRNTCKRKAGDLFPMNSPKKKEKTDSSTSKKNKNEIIWGSGGFVAWCRSPAAIYGLKKDITLIFHY